MSRKVFSLLLSTLTFHNKISHLKSNRWNVVAVPTEGKAKGSKTILTFENCKWKKSINIWQRLKHTNGANGSSSKESAGLVAYFFSIWKREKETIETYEIHTANNIVECAPFVKYSSIRFFSFILGQFENVKSRSFSLDLLEIDVIIM